MGLQLAPRNNKQQGYTRWTDEEILAQLEDFTESFVEWPTREEFIKHDKELLYQAIRKYGGIEHWAQQVGFVKPQDRGGRPTTPHQTYVLRLQALIEEYGDTAHLPPSHWIKQKDSGLYAYIGRTGGLDKWNTDMGFSPRQRGTQIKKWTETRLREEIKNFLATLDQEEVGKLFPTGRYFKTNKQRNLHIALSKYGGIRYWAKEFNLKLSPRSWKARPTNSSIL